MSEDKTLIELKRKTDCLLKSRYTDGSKVLGPIIEYACEPLVSLHDACIPLINTISNIEDYASIALKETPNILQDNLTRDESASIRLYTMEWMDTQENFYSILNKTLKTDNRENFKHWFKYLKLYLTALVKLPCAPSQTIWRRMRHLNNNEFFRGRLIT